MIRPSRHDFNIDRPVTVNRASGDPLPRSAGPRFDDEMILAQAAVKMVEQIVCFGLAIVFAASCLWFFDTFLAALPAISRVVTGGK